jgi:ubiquinone/menaquinone biosynthesis C-methylase UbiE
VLYRERVLPRLVECACGSGDLHRWRRRVTEDLSGEILEIGFGSGLNLGHYASDVSLIRAVEPSPGARRRSEPRIAGQPIPVEHLDLEAESLPLPAASCDGALSTFTLCTIADVERALAEVHRVLKPGGRFHFLEHGIAPDPSVRAWQARLEPFQRRIAGGCHLTRDPIALVEAAGFAIDSVEQRYARGPRPWTYFTLGIARRP